MSHRCLTIEKLFSKNRPLLPFLELPPAGNSSMTCPSELLPGGSPMLFLSFFQVVAAMLFWP
eukprot:5721379-Prymnesium_polylepis.2